jgi:hypothetical protein
LNRQIAEEHHGPQVFHKRKELFVIAAQKPCVKQRVADERGDGDCANDLYEIQSISNVQ